MTSIGEIQTLDMALAESLDVSIVQSLHAELKAALDSGHSLSLDGSKVSHIDTAALQVLAALFRDADGRRCKLDWRSPSEALIQGAKLLSVTEQIGLKAIED